VGVWWHSHYGFGIILWAVMELHQPFPDFISEMKFIGLYLRYFAADMIFSLQFLEAWIQRIKDWQGFEDEFTEWGD
jgi:hypothetical protein